MPIVLVPYTSNGTPQTGLSPTIDIRRLSDLGLEVTAGTMTHVGEGNYQYDFNLTAGFDPKENYAWRADGGGSLGDSDRYKFGGGDGTIARILGVLHENAVIDTQVWTTISGRTVLTSARLRTYDSKANAQAAGATGLLATYTMTATYDANGLQTNFELVLD